MTETITTKNELKEEISLTPKAAEEIFHIKKNNEIPGSHGLRVGVKEGGCCGFSYVLAFYAEPRERDQILQSYGVTVFVDSKSLVFLSGANLIFRMDLMDVVSFSATPNATQTCGRGDADCS